MSLVTSAPQALRRKLGALAFCVVCSCVAISAEAQHTRCRTAASGKGVIVLEVDHRRLSKDEPCVFWLDKGDQLVLNIVDANRVLYRYSTTARVISSEPVNPAVANLLARPEPRTDAFILTELSGTPCDSSYGALATPMLDASTTVRLLLNWASCLGERADSARSLLVSTDRLDGALANLRGETLREKSIEMARKVRAPSARGSGGTTTLRASWKEWQDQVNARELSADRWISAAASELSMMYPAMGDALQAIEDGAVGPLTIIVNTDTLANARVRLKVDRAVGPTWPLTRDHHATDLGVEVAQLRERASWFESSVGASFTPFTQQRTYTASQAGDSTIFLASDRDRLLPVASTVLTVRLVRTDWAFGFSGLLGVRLAPGATSLGESIDFGALISVGYRWLRVSAGPVFRREVDEPRLPGFTDGVRRFASATTRSLDEVGYRRKVYLGVLFSVKP